MLERMRGAASRGIACALILTLLGVGLTITASASSGATASHSGVLTVGEELSGATVTAFDPVQLIGTSCCFSYDWPIYGGLLRQTTNGTLVPDLASKVTIANPTTIDIALRSGLVYSNGAPLDAAAVKSALERNLSNPNPGAWDSSMYDIASITVSAPTDLVLHFSKPVANQFYPFLADGESFLALPTGSSNGNPNTNVVGAGPFILKGYQPGEKIVLVKNPRYWDAKQVSLSGITFVNVASGSQQVTALESGTVDVTMGLPLNSVPALANNPNFQVKSTFPDASYVLANLCKSSGPLANLQVRQALNYATNRVAINKAILFGKGQPAWSIFPTTSSDYDRSLTNVYDFDPKKAKQLLSAAGYPKGFSTTLMALPSSQDDQVAQVLQAEWKAIGVSVQIVPTTNYVIDLYKQHQAQIGLIPEGLTGIQKITTEYAPNTIGNLCDYSNPTLDALTSELQNLPPGSSSARSLWIKIQDIVIHNALGVYVVYSPLITAATKSVHNLQAIPYVGGVLNYWVMSVSS